MNTTKPATLRGGGPLCVAVLGSAANRGKRLAMRAALCPYCGGACGLLGCRLLPATCLIGACGRFQNMLRSPGLLPVQAGHGRVAPVADHASHEADALTLEVVNDEPAAAGLFLREAAQLAMASSPSLEIVVLVAGQAMVHEVVAGLPKRVMPSLRLSARLGAHGCTCPYCQVCPVPRYSDTGIGCTPGLIFER